MRFSPHTEEDIQSMLATIGVKSLDQLFDGIPRCLKFSRHEGNCPGLNEAQITRLVTQRAEQDSCYLNFMGGGAYEHHVPAAVSQIASREEFLATYSYDHHEASQGSLQLVYEYQSMMATLTALDISNAGLDNGSLALIEAVLMARRVRPGVGNVLVPTTLNPGYRAILRTMLKSAGIELVELAYDGASGQTDIHLFAQLEDRNIAAVIIPQINYFGIFEPIDFITDWAHSRNAIAVSVVNPIALALFRAPGEWGKQGADIAVGEGQCLGSPLSSGGSNFGFMCCKRELLPQMPGNIVTPIRDRDGYERFVLRNFVSQQVGMDDEGAQDVFASQGPLVIPATIYLAFMGHLGLAQVVMSSHANLNALIEKLVEIPGVERVFPSPVFNEVVLRVHTPVKDVLRALTAQGILGGINLTLDYPELGDAILICATEQKTGDDINSYTEHLRRIMSKRREAPPCAYKT